MTNSGAVSDDDDTKCFICSRNFILFRPAHRCKRCKKNVCDACSINNRYIPRQRRMRRVCDVCLQCEQEVTFTHRPRIRLRYDPDTRSTFIINSDRNSDEYATGLVNDCKIIAINNQNVELWIAEMTADKLNNVALPFSMILDYTKAETDYGALQKLKLKSIDNNWLGLGRRVFIWQYLENDGKWRDISYNVAHKIERLTIGQLEQYTMEYGDVEWKYTVLKQNDDECIQTNDHTRNQRDIRRILFDTFHKKRIVWQYRNDRNEWKNIYDCQQMLEFSQLKNDEITRFERGQWRYELQRVDDTNAVQTNIVTNKQRALRMIMKDKGEIDETFHSRVATKNKHYVQSLTDDEIHTKCICGVVLVKMEMNETDHTSTCVECKQNINDVMYRCNKRHCDEHKEGYDLCINCAQIKAQSVVNKAGNPSDCVVNDDNEVVLWLRDKVKMSQYIEMFIQHGYDEMNTVVHTLSLDILSQMGVKKIGHRNKLMLNVNKMRKEMAAYNQRVTSVESELFHDDKRVANDEKLKGNERILFIELAKKLQNDIENYQTDYVERNKSGKLKQMKLFAAKEAQVIRDWNTLKKGSFENLVEKCEEKYDAADIDDTIDKSFDVLIYKPLFDVIITCYDVLNALHLQIKNEYVYGQSYHIILMNMELFYVHVIKSKSEMKKKRFANICTYLKENVLHKIHIKMSEKHKEYDADCPYINAFIAKCCSVLWDIIGYEYSLYPVVFEFEHNQTYDASVHGRHGMEEGDELRYCVFPAMQKEHTYYSKIWVICNDIDSDQDAIEYINNTTIKKIKPKPGQESCWNYPRPPKVDNCQQQIKVLFNKVSIATTKLAMRVLETSHPPVYYIPQKDVNMEYLIVVGGKKSVCEFKGVASYYNICVNGKVIKKGAWSYGNPGDNAQGIKHHIAFYARECECFVDDEKATPQQGQFYGGWITSHVVGPFKGGRGTNEW